MTHPSEPTTRRTPIGLPPVPAKALPPVTVTPTVVLANGLSEQAKKVFTLALSKRKPSPPRRSRK